MKIEDIFGAVGLKPGQLANANIKQLRQLNADLINTMHSVHDRMKAERRTMTPEEKALFDGANAHAGEVAAALRRADIAADAERNMTPITDPDAEASRRAAARAGIVTGNESSGAVLSSGVASGRRFAEMFPRLPLNAGGFESAEDFLAIVQSGRHDPRLRASTMHGGDDPHGGFAVPTEFSARWLDAAIEEEIVRSRATVWPMASKTRVIPSFAANGGANENGPYGVPAQWIDESGETDLNQQQFTLETMTLTARSLALYVEVANALVADGLGFGDQLGMAMRRSGAWQLDRAFLRGTGVGMPLGVLNSTARVTVAKESGQAADTIAYTNVTKMLSRLSPGSFNDSVWIAHTTCLPQLLALSVPVGTGGSHVPAVVESNGRFTLLTRPLLFSEKVPSLGEEGDLGLYDFRAYQIGLRADVSIDVSGHVGFRANKTAFRLILRVDGMPGLRTPYTQPDGTTSSPFVVLGARA